MKGNEAWQKTKTLLFAIFLMTISFTPLLHTIPVKANTSYVEFSNSLQDKINESQNEDLIQINNSIILSDFIIINKSITLQGKTDSFIQINGSGFGFNITTKNVTIRNITLFNCSTALTIQNQSNPLENITIENVAISNCSTFGIYAVNATLINISESTLINCTSSGIYYNNVSNSTISYNFINQTTNTALNLTGTSDANNIYNNTFRNNTISVNITSSQNNTLYNNTFLNSTTFHAFDNANNNWNTTTHGNYWDDYQGTDVDNNDIGDINYTNIEGGSNTDEKPLGFFVPIVNFTYQPSSPSTANTITFTDHSNDPNEGNLNYSWDFETNGTIDSHQKNPTHSYLNNGTYNVTLNVTNQYGQWNSTYQLITVTNVAPILSFNISPTPGIVNQSVHLNIDATDSDGEITNWTWTLGEGTKKYIQNTTHIYNHSGSYTVTLNATDDDGEYTNITTTLPVTHKPTVNFTYSPVSPQTSDTITFTDTSTDRDGSISSWSWDFDDENTSTEENPTHSYDNDGSYNITLTVTDDDGATNQTSQEIIVLNTPPTANFTYTPHNATDLQTITFTTCSSDSDGSITNCTWTFGDGTTNYSMNATSHQYSDNGTYTVTLNVTDDDGDTAEYSTTINISNVGPNSDFTFEPTNPEVGETIWFNDTSDDQDGSINQWSWDFDDSSSNNSMDTTHIYSTLQSYDVTLTVTDNDGNSSSITKHLILKETITKSIQSNESISYDLKEEADATFCVKTSNTTNISITTYSECPSGIDKTIQDYENLQTYVDISLEEETLLDWINLSLYYISNDLSEDIDESSLTLFYWNETSEEWIQIQDTTLSTVDTTGYSGYAQANLSHLTLFTLAGKIIEDEDTPTPTLPNIINSSNSTTFSVSTPTLNITYDGIVPSLVATINGTTLLVDSKDNKTFSVFVHTDLQNGNYSVKLIITNSTLSRTDIIYFSIELPTITQKQNNPIEIPIWVWYATFGFLIGFILLFIENKSHFFKNLLFRKSREELLEETSETQKNTSQGFIKDTLLTLHRSVSSFDNTFFGSDDPWAQTKAGINQTMYNIDLFTEKPDAYVGIQDNLLTEQPQCKEIIDVIRDNESEASIEKIKEKTHLPKEELSKELTILLKYGLIKEQNQELFELTKQAKKIIEKNKDE